MRVLILTCSTGEGHNSAAAALKDEFTARGLTCCARDALEFLSKGISAVVSRIHSISYQKFPGFYGKCYRHEENRSTPVPASLMERGARKLRAFLIDNKINAVVSVHVFGGLLMRQTNSLIERPIPSYFVATDYTCSPYVSECQADMWFISHPSLEPEFTNNGVPHERICASGIPVRSTFYSKKSKTQARTDLNLTPYGELVLIASGSIGCGPLEEVCSQLLCRLPHTSTVVVICGHNEKLYAQLSLQFAGTRLRPVMYTDKMQDYMMAADVFVTKAGGVSTTEALVSGTKLVLMDAVPGCESRNFSFLTGSGLATGGRDADEIAQLVLDAIADGKPTSGFQNNGTKIICDMVSSGTASAGSLR